MAANALFSFFFGTLFFNEEIVLRKIVALSIILFGVHLIISSKYKMEVAKASQNLNK